MSEFKRFQRMFKSILPDFSRRRDVSDYYSEEDVRTMINELALDIPPKVLKGLLENKRAVDDFLEGVYKAEDKIGRRIVSPEMIIDLKYEPAVVVEEGRISFSVGYRGRRIPIAAYKINTSA